MTKASGETFQKYRLTHRISLGGAAEIYRAVLAGSKGFEKTVALKFLLPELAEDPEISQLFVDEARLCSHLQHPNIVQVHDFGVHDGRHFMAMEYIDGPNLKNLFNHCNKLKRPIPLELAAFIVQQVARGLDYAHRATTSEGKPLQLIHRDVSPQNILLSAQGDVKLTDFGIAKAAIKQSKTEVGTVKGKVRYMSPEQAQGQKIDSRSDQFSLGIVFYEAITGINVVSLKGSGPIQSNPEIPSPSGTRKELTPGLEKIVLRMLSTRPEDRYATCGEVAAALANELKGRSEESLRNELSEFIKGLNLRSSEGVFVAGGITPRGVHRNPSSKRRRFFMLLLLALSGASAIWLFLQGKKPESQPDVVSQLTTPKPTATPTSVPTSTPAPFTPTPTPKKAEKAQVIVTATPSTIPAPVVAVSTPTPSCSEGMLRIPAGAYFLGSERSDPDRNNLIEADWQSAKLSDYCIDRFEYPNQEGMIPRTNVTWSQARDLCAKEQKRLCTETEWERACKGTENYRYPYGSNSDSKRCNTQAQKNLLIPSGTFASCKSSFGTLDMSGNAEEWVEESARFERMSRIAKGGSASLPVWAARCASLREYRASTTLNTLGFRCCKDFK